MYSTLNLLKYRVRNLTKAEIRYEAEQNAVQAIYNRLYLQDERDRMIKLIGAYTDTVS